MREHREHDGSGLIAECLHPADGRRLRAQAWRHIRRLNPRNARRIWRAVRERDMSLARLAKRRDRNEPAIIEALERIGAEVWPTDRPADLAVWYGGRWSILEIKTARGRFSARQRRDRDEGLAEGIQTVRTPLEALRAIGAMFDP